MASINELTYGPIADQYASKYGIPTDVFRNAINSRSGFDPFYSGSKGDGIAAIANNSNVKGIDPYNVGQQLDVAAQDLKGIYKSAGSWDKAISQFGGDITDAVSGMANVDAMGNVTGISNEDAANNSDPTVNGGTGIFDTIKSYFTKYVYSGIIFIVGLLLILSTVYVVVTRGSGEK